MQRRILIALGVLGFLAVVVAAYVLGNMRLNPSMSDSEIAYRLERSGELELSRTRLLLDELSFRSSQCIPNGAVARILKWADKCVIPDCSIDINGKPFVGIVVTPSPNQTKGKPKP